MSHYRRARKVGGTRFFTVVSFRCQEILCDEWIRNALREGIKKTQQRYPFDIDACR